MAEPGSNGAQQAGGQAWKEAFAQQSFGGPFADDVVLEASAMRMPLRGKKDVQVTMQTASAHYASLEFTHEAVNGTRTYLEWEADAPTGTKFSGITILTSNADGCPADLRAAGSGAGRAHRPAVLSRTDSSPELRVRVSAPCVA